MFAGERKERGKREGERERRERGRERERKRRERGKGKEKGRERDENCHWIVYRVRERCFADVLTSSAGGETCVICGKKVYPVDKIVANGAVGRENEGSGC